MFNVDYLILMFSNVLKYCVNSAQFPKLKNGAVGPKNCEILCVLDLTKVNSFTISLKILVMIQNSSMNMKHSNCAVYTGPFHLIKWIFNLLVKLFALEQHQTHKILPKCRLHIPLSYGSYCPWDVQSVHDHDLTDLV